jgi:hypothetical protein
MNTIEGTRSSERIAVFSSKSQLFVPDDLIKDEIHQGKQFPMMDR